MLDKVNFDEAKQTQLPCVEIIINLGYKYISSENCLKERKGDTSNFLLKNIAQKKLMEINNYEVGGKRYKFSEKDVIEAIEELEHIPYEGLIDTSKKIYNTIMPTSGGKTISVFTEGKKESRNFKFIDFENIKNNDFHVTVEYEASGKQNIRLDVVCFINGIPFAVIENKKSGVEVSKAINQIIKYQGVEYCPNFFVCPQLLVASNGKEVLYGTTGTPNKFYSTWKEKDKSIQEINSKISELIQKPIEEKIYTEVLKDLNGFTIGHTQRLNRLITEQDKNLLFLFEPTRLLDLTKNYILFDAGVKKLSRYQQYFAIQKMQKTIEKEEILKNGFARRKGGLVWHTQGSGKSLTMVMFVKSLIENTKIANPRIIIVTDRRDLDRQIKDTFNNCNLKKDVIQATSGEHLLQLIKDKNLAVITTLVYKFESASNKKTGLIDNDKNIFVLVDEAHRSQSGIANLEMNRIIPNACYIGFTGTPLMKSERESWRKFGDYIDKYTIDDALEDKIILPLIYEGRFVELEQNAKQIDKHSDRISEDMSRKYQGSLKTKENINILQQKITAKIIQTNPQRIEEIARDIENHFLINFKNTGLKAQVVAPSKYSAVLFQKYFAQQANINTELVISDEQDDGDTDNLHKKVVVDYLNTIRANHSSVVSYEKKVIESFKHNDEGIEIIIVVDKLLTGFDAPRNTVLYLAKDLKDHNLLQAIARVNRLYDNKKLPKTAGYIIDYSENAKNIKTAMKLFGNYEKEDVKNTLIDVDQKIKELEDSYSVLSDLFKTLKNNSDDEAYIQYLKDEATRKLFYDNLSSFIKNLNECFILQDFVSEFKHLDLYKRDLKKFMELRKSASLVYKEQVDLSEYTQALIKILDKYVDARGVEILTKQINITNRKEFEEALGKLGSNNSKAEAIATQTKRVISEREQTDPEFYDKISKKINEILEKMRIGKMEDIEALKKLKNLQEVTIEKKDASIPAEIENEKGADIFYRNLREEFENTNMEEKDYIKTIIEINKIIKNEAVVDWYKNIDVKRKMKNCLDDYIYDKFGFGRKVNLNTEQIKSIIEQTTKLAEHNFELFL